MRLIDKNESAHELLHLNYHIKELQELDFNPDLCNIKAYIEKKNINPNTSEVLECKCENIYLSEYFSNKNA